MHNFVRNFPLFFRTFSIPWASSLDRGMNRLFSFRVDSGDFAVAHCVNSINRKYDSVVKSVDVIGFARTSFSFSSSRRRASEWKWKIKQRSKCTDKTVPFEIDKEKWSGNALGAGASVAPSQRFTQMQMPFTQQCLAFIGGNIYFVSDKTSSDMWLHSIHSRAKCNICNISLLCSRRGRLFPRLHFMSLQYLRPESQLQSIRIRIAICETHFFGGLIGLQQRKSREREILTSVAPLRAPPAPPCPNSISITQMFQSTIENPREILFAR